MRPGLPRSTALENDTPAVRSVEPIGRCLDPSSRAHGERDEAIRKQRGARSVISSPPPSTAQWRWRFNSVGVRPRRAVMCRLITESITPVAATDEDADDQSLCLVPSGLVVHEDGPQDRGLREIVGSRRDDRKVPSAGGG